MTLVFWKCHHHNGYAQSLYRLVLTGFFVPFARAEPSFPCRHQHIRGPRRRCAILWPGGIYLAALGGWFRRAAGAPVPARRPVGAGSGAGLGARGRCLGWPDFLLFLPS